MNNFNDRVYLLLTLKKNEVLEYYFQTVVVILAIAVYNVIGLVIHTPILINYWSLAVALLILTLLFLYIGSNALPIDWELLEHVEDELKKGADKPKEADVKAEDLAPVAVVEEVPSNEEIQMVEPDEDEFDFGDSLASLYKTGTPEQLTNSAVNGVEQKVRRMNLR